MGFLDFFGGEEGGVFDEAAEFFFADVMVGAFAGRQVLESLVLHLESFEVDDAQVEVALVPDLALCQFHWADDTSREREGKAEWGFNRR